MPASPVTPRGSLQTSNKSPRASPRVNRTPQTTPKSNSRQPSSPKPATANRKSSSPAVTKSQQNEQRPKLVKEGTFTKEPSPSVQSVNVDQLGTDVVDSSELNSNLKDKNSCSESLAILSSTMADTALEQAKHFDVDSQKKSNLTDVSEENNTMTTPGVNISSDYIVSLLLGEKGLGTSKLKSSGASRSVGNLMTINSPTRPVSPRSGPTTPTVGRKSIDSQLTDITAASKKSAKNKLSSLWHREKPSKSEMTKNVTVVNGRQENAVSDTKDKCREGLGKSPKSFRKSFPLRKSKKAAETSEPQVVENKLTRSETFDKLDSDQKIGEQSPDADGIMSSTVDGETEITSPASTDVSGVLHSSLDANETSTQPAGGKGFKGFFKRFAKDSKDKTKEDKMAEWSKSEVGQTKKKGFSLWRRDHSTSKKTKKKNGDGEWPRHSDGVVKSATLPSDVSVKASRSSESLSALRVPSSATTDALVSAVTPRRVSDISPSSYGSEPSSDFDTVNPSTDPSPPQGLLCSSAGTRDDNPFTEIISDTESSPPHQQRNRTSIVTTV